MRSWFRPIDALAAWSRLSPEVAANWQRKRARTRRLFGANNGAVSTGAGWMKRFAKALAALALMWAAPAAAQVVNVDGGAVRGKAFDGGGIMFRGIPFAAPPVENLRW